MVALHRGTQADDAFKEESCVDYKNDKFAYFFIGYTDNMMHTYGENGKEVQEYFKRLTLLSSRHMKRQRKLMTM